MDQSEESEEAEREKARNQWSSAGGGDHRKE